MPRSTSKPAAGEAVSDSRDVKSLRVRRSRFSSFAIDDRSALDLRLLLRGSWHVDDIPQFRAFSPISGKELELTPADIDILCRLDATSFVPVAELVDKADFDALRLLQLIESGLLISDAADSPDADYRETEERFTRAGWDQAALAYHCAAKWTVSEPVIHNEVAIGSGDDFVNRFDMIEKAHGDPPPHFFSTDTTRSLNLPVAERSGSVFEILQNRRTVRLFDQSSKLPLDTLASILYYVFGCFGWMRLSESLVALKKTSPSGGGLHPTEAYVLVTNVDGIAPGLYHYNVGRHRLDEISTMSSKTAGEMVVAMSAEQDSLATAPALVILVSRFDRLFWKYRNHKKAYKVSLMDAAHLSQTFYLVCEALGLGACFTGAIRDTVIEEHLNLDPVTQGVAGICACGIPSADGEDLGLRPTPYEPGSGEI